MWVRLLVRGPCLVAGAVGLQIRVPRDLVDRRPMAVMADRVGILALLDHNRAVAAAVVAMVRAAREAQDAVE